MTTPTITIRFTREELNLLCDQFGQSFAPGEPGNEDCDALSDKLSDAQQRLYRKERK